MGMQPMRRDWRLALIFLQHSGAKLRQLLHAETAMNLYHCAIDLKDDTKALAFAAAAEAWMKHLQTHGMIQSWRMCRRKLGFGVPRARDFLLEIELSDLAQLDQAFRFTATVDEDVEQLYTTMHQMVGEVDVALYRPFPDPERAERMALI